MATRAYFGIENKDGTIDYVYNHWDGYPEGLGRDLCALSRRLARSLVNEGDRSTFETSYASMRGQVCPFQTCVSRSGFLDKLQASSCEYAYLLTRHGAWLFASYNDRRFHSLKRKLKYND